MKKSLLALAALTAFAGVASAQSSVTLFGVFDVSARQVDNGSAGKLKTLSTDGNASSRLGFRGIEDLGGGLRAGFWLEGGFAGDVGGGQKAPPSNPTGLAPNTINGSSAYGMDWQRRSTVSLIGGFGEIRLGRDYTPIFNNFVTYDPWGYVGVAGANNIRANLVGAQVGAVNTAVRANNSISYFLPAVGGLYGQVMVAAGELTTDNKLVGGRVGYAAGPVNVSGSYQKTYKTSGLNGSGAIGVVSMIDDLKQWNIGASFNAGFLTVQGLYESATYSQANQKLGLVAVLIPVGSGTIKLSAERTTGNSYTFAAATGLVTGLVQDGAKATQYGAAYVYDLSKRTAVYGQVARISNTNAVGANRFTASSGGNPAGGQAGLSPAMAFGDKSTGMEVGIRHNF